MTNVYNNRVTRIGNTVTELDAATGALVHVLKGPDYRFANPSAVASEGGHVWVTNRDGGSMTEFPSAPE